MHFDGIMDQHFATDAMKMALMTGDLVMPLDAYVVLVRGTALEYGVHLTGEGQDWREVSERQPVTLRADMGSDRISWVHERVQLNNREDRALAVVTRRASDDLSLYVYFMRGWPVVQEVECGSVDVGDAAGLIMA